jgi:hypothetical protein
MEPKKPRTLELPAKKREADGAFKPAVKNFGYYFASGIQAQSDKPVTGQASSVVMLAPGWYSLGVEGNVPFVLLTGPTRLQKTLSWGETIAIPEGFAATLFNNSYHPGDIVLKGGQDWPTVPRRITVPVDFTATDQGTTWLINPQWPVDVRRARQAWLVWAVTITAGVIVIVSGRRVKGSHVTKGPGQVSGYDTTVTMPAGSFAYLPLGDGQPPPPSLVNLLPHALLDTARPNAFSVLKADVAVPLAIPMYYVVEY